ncbi:hypothetical protein [Enhygromyxa salina]|nr:hypothetical protein [Enhygromyxa salina]
MPTHVVEDLLPHGMVLGPQEFTPTGTHPITMWFYDMFQMHMNIPTPLPSMSYNEHVVGIPYVHTTRSLINPICSGPFFYMATLRLNSWLAIFGGRLFWGFEKNFGDITTSNGRFFVWDPSSHAPMVSLIYEPTGPYWPVDEFPKFRHMYALLQQPLISMLPGGLGPVFVASEFARRWQTATIQPLRASMKIYQSYVTGLPTGTFPPTGMTKSIEESAFGSFSLRMEYACGLIYPTWFCPISARDATFLPTYLPS